MKVYNKKFQVRFVNFERKAPIMTKKIVKNEQKSQVLQENLNNSVKNQYFFHATKAKTPCLYSPKPFKK